MGMLSGKTNGTNTGPTKVAAPQTAPAAAPAKAAPTGGTGFLARAKAAGQVQPTPEAREAARQAHLDRDFGPAKVPTGVVPPDAPSRMTPASAPQLAQDDDSAAAPAEAPKKRGRPPKAAQAQAEGAEDFAGEIAKSMEKRAAENGAAVRKVAGIKTDRVGFTIYLDTIVSKGGGGLEPTDLADWFGPIEVRLNEQAAEDRLPSWWCWPFAEQKAALSAAVQESITKGLPPAMFVSSGSSLARDILPMILPHASTVIRAVRG